ncbi:hypothetical protein BAUCODRAFT_57136, partial [Baudoinia panamericana UAMH 10762]
SRLHDSQEFTNFTIMCGYKGFKAHKVVVAAQSDYFRVACAHGRFAEGERNIILLGTHGDEPNAMGDVAGGDDPEVIELMIGFFYHYDYMISTGTPSNRTTGSSQCRITHAKLFAAAVKYQVPGLRALALSKFEQAAKLAWQDASFAEAVRVVYKSTLDEVRELRDVIRRTSM